MSSATDNVRVAPPIYMPTEVLPTIHKTEVLPTEVRRVEQHSTERVIQPVHREVLQPVETVVQKPIETQVQPIHEKIIQPKVDTTVHQAPSAVVAPVHETTKLETIHKKIEKEPIKLPTKFGESIPAPPTHLKDSDYRHSTATAAPVPPSAFNNNLNQDKYLMEKNNASGFGGDVNKKTTSTNVNIRS